MSITQQLTAVILAGGQGRRMGGVDKGWVELEGRPLIEHVLERLQPQVARLLINANRSLARYRALGYPVVSDLQAGYHGPLMGIATGLQAAATELVLFVPCDSPRLPEDLAARLYQGLRQADAELAVAHDGQRLHPVFALLRRDLQDELQAALAAGERKLARWFAQRRMVSVDFSDQPEAFVNVNRVEDMAAVRP